MCIRDSACLAHQGRHPGRVLLSRGIYVALPSMDEDEDIRGAVGMKRLRDALAHPAIGVVAAFLAVGIKQDQVIANVSAWNGFQGHVGSPSRRDPDGRVAEDYVVACV